MEKIVIKRSEGPKIIKLELPSRKGLFVFVKSLSMLEKATLGKRMHLAEEEGADKARSLAEVDLNIVINSIHDWNLYDENGEKYEINIENLDLISEHDVAFIGQEIQKQQKKS